MQPKSVMPLRIAAAMLAFPLPALAEAQSAPVELLQPVTVSPDDYPVVSLRNGTEGTVRILLTVEKDGRTSGCRILESANDPALDAKTCEIYLRQARFNTAADDRQRQAQATVRWSLEDTATPAQATPPLPAQKKAPSVAAFAFLDGFAAAYPQVRMHDTAQIDDLSDCSEFDTGLDACLLAQVSGLAPLKPVKIVAIAQLLDADTGAVAGIYAEYDSPQEMASKALNAKLGAPCLTNPAGPPGNGPSMWRNGEDFVVHIAGGIVVLSRDVVVSDADTPALKACL